MGAGETCSKRELSAYLACGRFVFDLQHQIVPGVPLECGQQTKQNKKSYVHDEKHQNCLSMCQLFPQLSHGKIYVAIKQATQLAELNSFLLTTHANQDKMFENPTVMVNILDTSAI